VGSWPDYPTTESQQTCSFTTIPSKLCTQSPERCNYHLASLRSSLQVFKRIKIQNKKHIWPICIEDLADYVEAGVVRALLFF
jgi:hypothetical protein